MRVVFTRRAETDLETIADHIAEDNPGRAVTFVLELRQSCLGIADLPLGYPAARRLPDNEIRRRVHSNYLIFYRLHGGQVEILRILHGAMDYEHLFPADE